MDEEAATQVLSLMDTYVIRSEEWMIGIMISL
jgi:hypothetical protein